MKKAKLLMFKINNNEKQIKKMEELNCPQQTIKDSKDRLKTKFAILSSEFGLTEEDYKKFVRKEWLTIEGAEMHAERMGKCLAHLRIIQQNGYDIYNDPCQDKDCFDCDDYKEATEEQNLRYCHGQDVDTGEKIVDEEDFQD